MNDRGTSHRPGADQHDAEQSRRYAGWHSYDWFKTVVAAVLVTALLYGWSAGVTAGPGADQMPRAADAIAPTDASQLATEAVTAVQTAAPTVAATQAPTAALAAPTARPTVQTPSPVPATPTTAEPRPADVLLVMDVSGSMEAEGRIEGARAALAQFVDVLEPRDRIQIVTFSGDAETVLPLSPVADVQDEVARIAAGLTPAGPTRLYDATLYAFAQMATNGDPQHTRAIILLTDGRDERLTEDNQAVPGSQATLQETLTSIAEQASSGITLYTIGYGADADNAVLAQLAEATNGRHFAAGPSTIQEVYQTISGLL